MTDRTLKPVAWMRTRKSSGEVDIDFDGPVKHAELFDWLPLVPAPTDEEIRRIGIQAAGDVFNSGEWRQCWTQGEALHMAQLAAVLAIGRALGMSESAIREAVSGGRE